MGFPDTWSTASYVQTPDVMGKAVTVEAAKWVSRTIADNLSGNTDETWWPGLRMGEREYLFNFNDDHKQMYEEKSGARIDSRSKLVRQEIKNRMRITNMAVPPTILIGTVKGAQEKADALTIITGTEHAPSETKRGRPPKHAPVKPVSLMEHACPHCKRALTESQAEKIARAHGLFARESAGSKLRRFFTGPAPNA